MDRRLYRYTYTRHSAEYRVCRQVHWRQDDVRVHHGAMRGLFELRQRRCLEMPGGRVWSGLELQGSGLVQLYAECARVSEYPGAGFTVCFEWVGHHLGGGKQVCGQ